MDVTYPPGPTAVPPDLTQPTAAYKRHAWLAMLGLAAFITLYFALSAWFAWTAWRLLAGMFSAHGDFELWGFIAGICSTFLAVFMLKALFFIQHRYEIEDLEVTRQQEPRLFEFIDRLADEARAPRAHKVYLSPRVNAAVFYDLSLLNLIIPSKKNLEIGLGLVNVLSLGELKAVLAHEFGHFAQRSMAVGRWVYIARQIAGHVVARRDVLDKLLRQLSRFDLRVAWVGWLLSMIVWSIRSMMDVLFRLVLLAERALSRQMEFQADLVAVSLTGSDALIHALHRLHSADDAWDKSVSFAFDEANKERRVSDVFAVQARIIERMREILNQPDYGIVPPVPDSDPQGHRLFKSALAQSPRMWSTHPPSADREHNAKQRYVSATVDARPAWELFSDATALRESMTAHILRKAEKLEPTPMATTLENLEKDYGRPYLDRKYRGIYLGRSPVRHASGVDQLYGAEPAADRLIAALDALYPESLAARIEQLNDKLEQKYALQALRDQVAEAPGGIIRHNGVELRRKDLPGVIAQLAREVEEIRSVIESHDRDVRTAHLAAARTLGKGWPEYLRGLAAVLHYADHSEANLRDAQGHFVNIYNVVTADGRVSSSELGRLVAGCQELYRPLNAVYSQRSQLTLDRTLLRRLETDGWMSMIEEFKLPGPDRENMSRWLGVIDSWVGGAVGPLSAVRSAALEQLLLAESQVAKFVRERMPPADAPPPSVTPADYLTLEPGQERPRQQRLDWWDRFQTADGVVPMIARSAVAVGVVGGVVALGGHVGSANLTIYNGLGLPVWVSVSGNEAIAKPFEHVTIEVPASGKLDVRTMDAHQALIESFEEESQGTNAHYVYNVAGAAPLIQQSIVYYQSEIEARNNGAAPERQLGAARWQRIKVDYLFEEPPHSIKLNSNSNGYREAVRAASEAAPWQQAELITNETERANLVLAHARWDDTSSHTINEWLALAASMPEFTRLFAERLERTPADVILLRFEQDYAQGSKHEEVCARQSARAAAQPANGDLQYLAIRCMADNTRQNAEFIAAQKKWPDNAWLSMAAAATYAEMGNYAAAAPLYEKSRRELPGLGEYLATNIARVRAISDERKVSEMHDLLRVSQQLQFYAAIETGRDILNTPLEPLALMADGSLDSAVQSAQRFPQVKQRVMRLVAASYGATPQMITAALDLPVDEDSDISSTFVMFALAANTGRDTSIYAARINKLLSQVGPPVVQFLEKVRRGEDPVQARQALPTTDLGLRLYAINAAVIMLGPRAPQSWRKEVLLGLFQGERPYYEADSKGFKPGQPPQSRPRDSKAARILSSPVG